MTKNKRATKIVSEKIIQNKIFLFRGKRVMLDRDLAELYAVETRVLNQAVKRNIQRFPEDFMFQLNNEEKVELITICDNPQNLKFTPANPYVFTEQGVTMLSCVLNSQRAIQVNIQIMRTFTKLRELMFTHKDLRCKIEAMEKKYDHQFKIVFEAIKKLLEPPAKPKDRIGFRPQVFLILH